MSFVCCVVWGFLIVVQLIIFIYFCVWFFSWLSLVLVSEAMWLTVGISWLVGIGVSLIIVSYCSLFVIYFFTVLVTFFYIDLFVVVEFILFALVFLVVLVVFLVVRLFLVEFPGMYGFICDVLHDWVPFV